MNFWQLDEWFERKVPLRPDAGHAEYGLLDVSPTGDEAVHVGACPVPSALAAFTSDDRQRLHLLCLDNVSKILEGGPILAIHGVTNGPGHAVSWDMSVVLADDVRWFESAVLAVVPGGAFAAFLSDLDPGSSWAVQPLLVGARAHEFEAPLGFLTRGKRFEVVTGRIGGSFEADFYRYHLHSFGLDGSRSIHPLEVMPDGRLPISYPTSFHGPEEWPWERDVPTLWNESQPGRLEMGLPLARTRHPRSATETLEVLPKPGIASFKNARSPVGPQTFGYGIASYQRDLSTGWLHRTAGDDLLICDDQPRWMRVSCDGMRCVAVCLVPSVHDMWRSRERLLIRRFSLAN